MKKFLINLLFFSLFSLVFYVTALLLSGKFLPTYLSGNLSGRNVILAKDGSARRFIQAKKHDIVDVLILGSSHACRSYDVRLFEEAGLTAYTLGSSSQPLSHSLRIYKKYVNTFSPRILIIDVYPVLLNASNTESILNTLPLFYEDEEFIYKAFCETYDIRLLHSLFYYKIFGDIKSIDDKLGKGDTYIRNGYVENNNTVKKLKDYPLSELMIDDNNIRSLREIVNDAKERGIHVFLFNSPLPMKRYESYINSVKINQLLSSIATYYDYNEAVKLGDSYFYDEGHINQKGVNLYCDWVLKRLKKRVIND